ncbi:MAG: phosphoribosylamine--glycine ligase [Rubricoccaceae bacterium]
MRILVVGSGGREHALCDALARSTPAPELLCAPGNPGTAALAENVPVAADDGPALVALARSRGVGLVVIGPEAPLVAGLADALRAAGIATLGPDAYGARLEGSKAFAKAFMARHGIPTAPARAFGRAEAEAARAFVEAHPLPVVLKADGLAAGKGVVVATTRAEARRALDGLFGTAAGATLVVEAFLKGEEASVFAVCDGRDYVLLAPAQDHKRIGEGDTGPNTGGMGAYAPAPVVTEAVLAAVRQRVVEPVLRGLNEEGHPYRGVLYCGLMVGPEAGPDGLAVVEFNVRLGDPEAQVVLPLLAGDAAALFAAAAEGRLAASGAAASLRAGAAACVVLASHGYPGAYETGHAIGGLEAAARHARVYHAGTRDDAGRLVTAGGRVLGLTGLGPTLSDALAAAYRAADAVAFEGKTLRRDIGQKGLGRSEAGREEAGRAALRHDAP